MYISKLFLLMMDLLNLETPLENPGYAPDTRDATIHNLDVSMCVSRYSDTYIARYNQV